MSSEQDKPVFLVGRRTAFIKSFDRFEECDALFLSAHLIAKLLDVVGLDSRELTQIIACSVIPRTENVNLARDVALYLRLPSKLSAYSLNQICTSSLQGVVNSCISVAYYKKSLNLVFGVECLSNIPIVYSQEARKFFVKLSKAKSTASKLNIIKNFKAGAWFPKKPELLDSYSNRSMLFHCENLNRRFGVSKSEQDRWAWKSHKSAQMAKNSIFMRKQLVPIWTQNSSYPVEEDFIGNSFRNIEELSASQLLQNSVSASITKASSSPLCDGASACLITNRVNAARLGMSGALQIVDFEIAGEQPNEFLLMAGALSLGRLLVRNKKNLSDIDAFEIHESFATQALLYNTFFRDRKYCQRNFNTHDALGEIQEDKINIFGGSLAFGHPFGATGIRLLINMSSVLLAKELEWGVISMGGASGIGISLLVKRLL